MDLRGYCAAPWVEGVLYQNGKLQTCCRNSTNLGNWKQMGLKKAWRSKSYQKFRKSICEGRFHDSDCENCYSNGTARTLKSELAGPFAFNIQVILDYFKNEDFSEIIKLKTLFSLRKANPESRKTFRRYFSAIRKINHRSYSYPNDVINALYKLTIIGKVAKSFLQGDSKPKTIAPFRQVQLVSKCNARCVHCTGRFTGEIVTGTALENKYVEEAFSSPKQILDFYMNGSEFLIYKDWQKIAHMLCSNGTKISISTNGIRLTEENVRHLIDNKIIHSLNISMDGANKEMLESIRVKVKFDELISNIKFLFKYASKRNYNFSLSFSFVLMKKNAHEFPQLVRLVKKLKSDHHMPNVIIYCQSLDNYPGVESYSEFVLKQHHSLLGKARLEKIFTETLESSKKTGIPVMVFYSNKLSEFVKQGCPYPAMPAVQLPQANTGNTARTPEITDVALVESRQYD